LRGSRDVRRRIERKRYVLSGDSAAFFEVHGSSVSSLCRLMRERGQWIDIVQRRRLDQGGDDCSMPPAAVGPCNQTTERNLRGHYDPSRVGVVVHYLWHPLHGRCVRCHYSERRTAGACAAMEIGSPALCAVRAGRSAQSVDCARIPTRLPVHGWCAARPRRFTFARSLR
jgi:hypothetical protein